MPATFSRDRDSAIRVFISHVPHDESHLKQLSETLRNKKGPVRFEVYSSLEVLPGDVFEEVLSEWLDQSQIVLLLVSPAYLISSAVEVEIKAALERRSRGQLTVVPVVLAEVDWSDVPFANLKALPPDNKAVDDWSYSGLAYKAIVEALSDLVEKRRAQLKKPGARTHEAAFTDFKVRWTEFSFITLSISIVWLGWFAAHPLLLKPEAQVSSPWGFTSVAAVVGIASMSMIQIARRLFPLRGFFHRDALRRWLGDAGLADLYTKVRTGRIFDMFDLPSEMLAGQLSALAEQAIDEEVRTGKVSALVDRMALDGETFRLWQPEAKMTPDSEALRDGRMNRALAVQRNLDQFQIATSAAWRRYLLLTSITLSIVLFISGLQLFHSGAFIQPLDLPGDSTKIMALNFSILLAVASLTGLFGGFLGSIARDMVAFTEKIRR